ncbi:sensor histidine kinase [Fulvivirga sediminis]|uniref:Histidine kinase n=1 Tax=Fulvivirga sediminis TaxID=2803949 RepID=A0A937K0M9_9BACT|nr:histidine kinase [Fulvivirga sediminis]MBL3657789.1 histidine kinase [Fulvivirga sediminis]
MKHPLVNKNIFIYLLAWVIVALTHISILHFHYEIGWLQAFLDSAVFNLLMAALGLSYWYVIQFVSPAQQGLATSIVSIALSLLISLSLIDYIAFLIISQIFSDDQVYIDLLSGTMPWRLLVGILYLLIIIMVYYLLKYNTDLNEREQRESEMRDLLKHSELEMLKFQINPHFIFNSLNSVSSLTITEPEIARDMVIKLSDFLRSSLGRDAPESHNLKEELLQMNLYLDIEKIRFGDRLCIKNEIDSQCENMTLPNMILQPLYENAIKYGIYEQLEEVTIHTKCTCDDGNLKIAISNSYDSESVPLKGKGIGLRNVRNRLELIYGIPGLVTIQKERRRFTVILLIPQNLITNDQVARNR